MHPTRHVPDYTIEFDAPRRHRHALVIPVINEGGRLHALLQSIQTLGIDQCLDIVVVDGGSTDGSVEPALLLLRGVRTLLVKRAPGKLSAQLRCAYDLVLQRNYEGVVTIDGNNKDDPGAIRVFIEKLCQGFDFVQASRFIPGGVAENTPVARTLAIRCLHAPLLSMASGFRWTDTTQGFRGYSRRLLESPQLHLFRDVFDSYELLAYLNYAAPRAGMRCVEVPTHRRYPRGEPAPTKIHGFAGNLALLKILVSTCTGKFDPLPLRR